MLLSVSTLFHLCDFIKITNYVVFLCSCFAIAIQADFRQSFGDSISITAQCIETQLMPNESSGKDLQIICGHFYVKSLIHGVICVTECQRPSNCFFLFFLSFLLSFFSLPRLGYCNGTTSNKISTKLHMYTHG